MINYVSCRWSGYRHWRLLWCGALVLALAPFQVNATEWGSDTGFLLKPAPNGGYDVVPGPGGTRPSSVVCSGGSCTVGGSKNLPGVSPSTPFRPSSPFTKPGIALGAAKAAGRLLPIVSTGMALYDLYQAAGLDDQDGQVVGGVQLAYFGWAETIPDLIASPSTGISELSRLCSLINPTYMAAGAPMYYETSTQHHSKCGYWSNDSWTQLNLDVTVSKEKLCVDVANRRTFTPVNGSCGTATTALSESDIQQRLESAPISDEQLERVIRELWERGYTVPDAGPPSVTGPTSVQGPTTTTTTSAANGTTQVTTTTTNYNVTYNNNNVVINQTKTTTNPDGSTQTETQQKEQTPEPCDVNPTSAGCTELGDPGAAELPTVDKPITFTPVSFTESSTCPAPISFSTFGRSYLFSYDPMCETIGAWVRALVLAIGAFIASWVFVQGLKS